MQQAPGEAVQKVCPRCSTLAYTGDRHCPWCGASYKRRAWPGLLVLLLVQTALVLGGVAAMFILAGEEVDRKLDDEISRVERDLDASFDEVERAVREELDERVASP
jgi:RNA polymerase subunit RPABC4/transcription elongation factor Spt4